MPKPNGDNIRSQGTNAQGNNYTNYNNGGFRYVNINADGQRISSYFDNGRGSGFYKKNSTPEAPGYRFYENHKTGERHYLEKGGNKGGNSSEAKK